MADKKTHFGRAGEYFAMSELLLRGWNVAVPVVDVGDDVFVIDDKDKTTFRLQVKSASGATSTTSEGVSVVATFALSRSQLRTPQPIELFFMLMVRVNGAWRYLIIPREDLLSIRDNFVDGPKSGKRGRPALPDDVAKTDSLVLTVVIKSSQASAWDGDLSNYIDTWPDSLAPVEDGPGTVGQSNA